MRLSPFLQIPLFTGQKNGSKAFGNEFRRVGAFKGLVRLTDSKDSDNGLNLNELLRPKEVFVRVYILQGHRLNPKDSDGSSDPYLIVKLAGHRVSTRDRYIKSNLEPDFYEAFEFPCTLPGDSRLEVKVMDWDGIGDDLIGSTVIDLEDRWFSKSWRKLKHKPIERRTLHAPSSSAPQGKLSMFIDILTADEAKRNPLIHIKPPAPEPYELRVIVWGCREVTIKDEFTEQNDLYVTGQLDVPGVEMQSTDTHLRSKNGKGNFNWRFKFPIYLPAKNPPRFRMQIWDLDFFSADDSICEIYMSLKGLCKKAFAKKDRIKVTRNRKERFWFEDLRHSNFPGNQGRLEVSMEIMPKVQAEQIPAGFGRSDPNCNPYLPEPEGRVQWSLWHPIDMLEEILGKNICRKLICIFVLAGLVTAIYFITPMIVSNVIANKIAH
eukprot:TRINITY_DN1241_c0_g1_i9.p2 TRINITY_DN1241_c0_g1~~TRINITY_DN1241_c0_g1_i9.p2  ORF type:complete len:435 (-),score=156.41 TRINITY_DN1241_c0_g1_i9:61-1365(-)